MTREEGLRQSNHVVSLKRMRFAGSSHCTCRRLRRLATRCLRRPRTKSRCQQLSRRAWMYSFRLVGPAVGWICASMQLSRAHLEVWRRPLSRSMHYSEHQDLFLVDCVNGDERKGSKHQLASVVNASGRPRFGNALSPPIASAMSIAIRLAASGRSSAM